MSYGKMFADALVIMFWLGAIIGVVGFGLIWLVGSFLWRHVSIQWIQ